MTVSEYRDNLSYLSLKIHKNDTKEFYLIHDDKYITKHEIPVEVRKEFEEFYDEDLGGFVKDTAEYICGFCEMNNAVFIIMDYEIDNFIENLVLAKKDVAEIDDEFNMNKNIN